MSRYAKFHSAILLVGALTLTAQAHHSFAAFDKTKTDTLAGTVKFFEFTNPHVWIWLSVPGTGPNTGLYGFESGGPSQYDRMGISRSTFAPGTEVTITYHPMRDGRKGGQLLTAKFANGDVLDIMKQVKIFSNGEVQ